MPLGGPSKPPSTAQGRQHRLPRQALLGHAAPVLLWTGLWTELWAGSTCNVLGYGKGPVDKPISPLHYSFGAGGGQGKTPARSMRNSAATGLVGRNRLQTQGILGGLGEGSVDVPGRCIIPQVIRPAGTRLYIIKQRREETNGFRSRRC